MNRFVSGLVAGGIIGSAIGMAAYGLSNDKSARRKIVRESKKMANKAADAFDDMF